MEGLREPGGVYVRLHWWTAGKYGALGVAGYSMDYKSEGCGWLVWTLIGQHLGCALGMMC